MNLKRLGGSLAVASLSIGLAACGNSAKTSSTTGGSAATSTTATPPPLAKAALIARANTICKTAQAAATAVPAPTSYADAKVAAAYFDKIVPITDKETQDLLALTPASGVQAAYAKFTSAQQASDTLLQTIRHKADTQDASGQHDLATVPAVGQKVADAANALGAGVCAK